MAPKKRGHQTQSAKSSCSNAFRSWSNFLQFASNLSHKTTNSDVFQPNPKRSWNSCRTFITSINSLIKEVSLRFFFWLSAGFAFFLLFASSLAFFAAIALRARAISGAFCSASSGSSFVEDVNRSFFSREKKLTRPILYYFLKSADARSDGVLPESVFSPVSQFSSRLAWGRHSLRNS